MDDRSASSMKMSDSSKIRFSPIYTRDWAKLNSVILALIFVRVKPVDLMVRTVPFVCRSWRKAAAEPDCWAHVDIERWCRRVSSPSATDAVLRKLARRSRGTMQSLSVYRMSDPGFFFVCSSGSKLTFLKMPMSEVTDQMVEKHVESLSMLTILDISYCLKITPKCIETIGNCCKGLVEFKRNMPPPNNEAEEKTNESEAMAVANTMHGVENLEFAYGLFSNHGLAAILSNCGALRALDIRGCWNVNMVGEIKSKCYSLETFGTQWENESDGFSSDRDYDYDVDVETSEDGDDDGHY